LSIDVRFPDGTVVRASALSDRNKDEGWREYGLYLDPMWRPSWEAELIGWEDFGIPEWPEEAAEAIGRAFALARSGKHVEVGCLAGMGRTGTVLACMAILAGVPPTDAVSWVKWNYHPDAIANAEQEQWVGWFGARIRDTGRT
jgi:hypothetical protein